MICSLLLLERLHSAGRRRLALLPLMLALSPACFGAAPAPKSAAALAPAPAVPVSAQPPIPSASGLSAVQIQTDLLQYQSLRAQLLEERRQALVAASKQTDPAARLKIMTDLLASQSLRRQQLRKLHTEVQPLEQQTQAAARTAKVSIGK